MLQEIRIQDLGIIEESLIEFGPGLTVLTGETGAGKTMVVTSLGLLLGARSDAGLVREGADRAVIEGVFDVPADSPATLRALEAGGEVDDTLVLVRTVQTEGRSRNALRASTAVSAACAPASTTTTDGRAPRCSP